MSDIDNVPVYEWNRLTGTITKLEGQYLFDPEILAKVRKDALSRPIQEKQTTKKNPKPSSTPAQLPTRLSKTRKPKVTLIYLIQHGQSRSMKIGLTKDLRGRIKGLQTGSPITLSLQYAWEVTDASSLENLLHRRFSNKQVLGEWFELSLQDEADLIAFMSEHPRVY
jgi:hypothetical protein